MMTDRELDTLIGEKVMGTQEVEVTFVDRVDQKRGTITLDTEFRHLPYSTDIAAAWKVVHRLFDLGYEVVNVGVDAVQYSQAWSARLASYGGKPTIYETGSSAPNAICKAALKAIGHKNET